MAGNSQSTWAPRPHDPGPWGCGILFCALVASVGLAFVALRPAAAAGTATVCLGIVVYAWRVVTRPAERVCLVLGALALAAAGLALLYGPWPPAVPAGVFAAGVAGCAAGLAVAARHAPTEALADAIASVVVLPTLYLLVAGVWAMIAGARADGQLALVAGIAVATLGVTWAGTGAVRWYWRVVVVVTSLAGVLSVVALFFDRYRWLGVSALRFVALVVVVSLVAALVRARPWQWRARARARHAMDEAYRAMDEARPVAPRPWSPADVALRELVADAVRLAASERATDEPLTTGQVLAALVRMDIHADWQRIWLHTGDPTAHLPHAPDPPGGNPADWHSIPFSGRLARSFALLQRLTHSYPDLYPAGSGITMLALVADPASGACTTVLRHGTVSHGRLLQLIQTDVIKLNLPGVSALILDTLDAAD